MEQIKNFNEFVNGEILNMSDCGFLVDKSFRRIDISSYVKFGKNVITMFLDFKQGDVVYENLEKAKAFEAEKNKLTFDLVGRSPNNQDFVGKNQKKPHFSWEVVESRSCTTVNCFMTGQNDANRF